MLRPQERSDQDEKQRRKGSGSGGRVLGSLTQFDSFVKVRISEW